MLAKNKKQIVLWGVVAAAVLAVAALVGVIAAQAAGKPAVTQASGAAAAQQADSEGFGDTVTYNGKQYRRNTALQTVLFLGIDESDKTAESNQMSSQGRSDTILLFVLDSETKTTHILEISRDTMMDVDIYNDTGDIIISDTMQLALEYAFAPNRKRGNWLTANKVSELLYGIPINSTVSFTLDGIAPVVDALGGVTVTVPADYTYLGEAYTQGSTLTLDGLQAERYIRYRDTSVTGSNDTRMERQQQFLKAMYQKILLTENAEISLSALKEATSPYIESNVDAETLQSLSQYTMNDTIEKVPGETKAGQYHDEYYVDEDALQRLVLDWFYEPVA